jgi:DNA-binding NarL/FixJ family response regulator
VANYQSSIKQKLDVSNTAQVVRIALSHGFLANAPEGEELQAVDD